MKEQLRKFGPWVLYPTVYLICLCVFAAMTFPYEKLKERIVTSINAQQRASGGQQEIAIDEMTSYRVTGVRARGVRILSTSSDPTMAPNELKVDEIAARVSIFPLLIGNVDVSFQLDGFGGTVTGSYDTHGKDKSLAAEFDGVDVGQISMIADLVGLPVEGRIGGTVDLSLPEGKVSKGTGTVALDIKDVAVGDGKAKLKGAFALPRVSVGDVTLSAEAKDGVLKVTKLAAGGKDLELQGDGRIQLREVLSESQCDLNVRFKINDAYRTKSEITKSLFGAPGSAIPPAFEIDPRVKQSKRPDGFYAWALRGQLAKLEPTPAGGAGPPGAPGGGAFGMPRGGP